jgi:hypothetical protein
LIRLVGPPVSHIAGICRVVTDGGHDKLCWSGLTVPS